MVVNRLTWLIGGWQGSGIATAATLFARVCNSSGLWLYGNREYHSNIIGDHSYFQVRVSEKPVHALTNNAEMICTYDRETVILHKSSLSPDGVLLYDPAELKPGDLEGFKQAIPVPYDNLIAKVAGEFPNIPMKTIDKCKNVLSVSASLGLMRMDFDRIRKVIEELFIGRRAALAPFNVRAAELAYQLTSGTESEDFPYRLKPIDGVPKRLFIDGVQAVGMAKLLAGCRFQTYYPITPASDESVFLEGYPEYGMLVVQSEDEIAAITSAVGAAMTGVRSSTSTSGPGFSLMAEGMGWAGMNEVPVVIVNYQRGGPATGLPTRHEQGDLAYGVNAAHGDFPRIVMAPGDMEEYFYDTLKAFNYAERYQTPVILMCDKALASTTESLPVFTTDSIKVDRGKLASKEQLIESLQNGGAFKRFQFTEDGISPRPLLGQEGGIYWMSGDDHDEYGHITENPDNRIKMHRKRMIKEDTALREIPIEDKIKTFGPEAADISIVTWGSNKGAILEAMEHLEADGLKVNLLQIRLMRPFPAEEVKGFLSKAKKLICVEMNYSGQMAGLVRQHTGCDMDHHIRKWNGRVMSWDEIYEAIQQILKTGDRKVVLTHGV